MKVKQNPGLFAILAGVAFAVSAILQVMVTVEYFSLTNLLFLVSYAMLAAVLFMKRRNILFLLPAAVVAALDLYTTIRVLILTADVADYIPAYHFLMFNDILDTLSKLTLAFAALSVITGRAQKHERTKHLAYISVGLSACYVAFGLLSSLFFTESVTGFLGIAISGGAIMLAALWLSAEEKTEDGEADEPGFDW